MHDRLTAIRDFILANFPWLLVVMLVLIGLMFGDSTRSFFEYQRQSILTGGFHRVFTGHLIHTNAYHGLLNLLAMIVIGMLASSQLKKRDWGWGLVICMSSISLGLIIFDPQLEWYRGLSGVLHGMLVILIFRARQLPGVIRLVFFTVLLLKVLLEQWGMGFWQSESAFGAPVIVDAHLYGVIGGAIAYLFLELTRSKRMFREEF